MYNMGYRMGGSGRGMTDMMWWRELTGCVGERDDYLGEGNSSHDREFYKRGKNLLQNFRTNNETKLLIKRI